MDARTLFLTANTESVYIGGVLDLSDGPVVVESPPNTLATLADTRPPDAAAGDILLEVLGQ